MVGITAVRRFAFRRLSSGGDVVGVRVVGADHRHGRAQHRHGVGRRRRRRDHPHHRVGRTASGRPAPPGRRRARPRKAAARARAGTPSPRSASPPRSARSSSRGPSAPERYRRCMRRSTRTPARHPVPRRPRLKLRSSTPPSRAAPRYAGGRTLSASAGGHVNAARNGFLHRREKKHESVSQVLLGVGRNHTIRLSQAPDASSGLSYCTPTMEFDGRDFSVMTACAAATPYTASTSISSLQWSLAPHSSTEFIARTAMPSWKPREAKT